MTNIKYHLLEPLRDGILEFSVFGKPVSFQSSKSHKGRITRKIQRIVAPVKYILSGYVQFEIQWIVPEKFIKVFWRGDTKYFATGLERGEAGQDQKEKKESFPRR